MKRALFALIVGAATANASTGRAETHPAPNMMPRALNSAKVL